MSAFHLLPNFPLNLPAFQLTYQLSTLGGKLGGKLESWWVAGTAAGQANKKKGRQLGGCRPFAWLVGPAGNALGVDACQRVCHVVRVLIASEVADIDWRVLYYTVIGHIGR